MEDRLETTLEAFGRSTRDDDDRRAQERAFKTERSITLSMNPYCRASSAVNQRSRSESASIRSSGCPVWKEMRSAIMRLR